MKVIQTEKNVPAVMRDGTTLYADMYYPESEGPLPALLMRLPYDKSHGQDYVYPHPKRFAMHGYLVVVQDTRGRWSSEGEFYPFRNEMEDGYDTVEWVASHPKCNGNVGMYGFSYVGVIQLLAAAAHPPHLRCICPAMTGSQLYEGWTHNNGAFALAFNLSWALELAISDAHRRGSAELEQSLWMASQNIKSLFAHLPLDDIEVLKQNNLAPYYFEWIKNSRSKSYWHEFDFNESSKKIQIPSLFIGGWYDVFREGVIANYQAAKNAVVRKLVIGPWYHVPWTQEMGDVDFGLDARNFMGDLHLNWFDHWLKGDTRNALDEPSIKYFLMGSNEWREGDVWPPRETEKKNLYFHSVSGANSRYGDGSLDYKGPDDEQPDVFVYDPRSPVASQGGHSCCFPAISPMGPFDQSKNEQQNQILVFSSETLTQELCVAGEVEAEIFVSSSALDTDFVIKLIDVNPEGQAINILEGIQRMSYRLGNGENTPLVPEEIYKVIIKLGNTCYLFKKDHQIRVEISSSDFPQWDRNTNSGKMPATDDFRGIVPAIQTFYHEQSHPSHLVLPVWNNYRLSAKE